MSLDVYLGKMKYTTVYSANITHNLNKMADAAGIYRHLWRPEELFIKKAIDLIAPLKEGLNKLKECPEEFDKFNSPHGWGTREQFVYWLEEYIVALEEHPDADVSVSR